MNSILRVIVRPHKPLFYGNYHVKCEGVLCHLIEYLSKSMNFTPHFIIGNDRGTFDTRNNSWSEVLGLIQRNVNLIMVRF